MRFQSYMLVSAALLCGRVMGNEGPVLNSPELTDPSSGVIHVPSLPGQCGRNLRPTAAVIAPRYGAVGVDLPFDATWSRDRDGVLSNYRWDFGDGAHATGANAMHRYSAPGVYQVTLEVVDNCGASGIHTFAESIGDHDGCENNRIPIARAGADQTRPVGTPVVLNGVTSIDPDGMITGYLWTFGDGTSSGLLAVPTVQHTYTTPQTYLVTLVVIDNCGATSPVDTAQITIYQPDPCQNNTPPTAVGGPNRSGGVGQPVTFDASASTDAGGQVTAYFWNFGDGSVTGWQPNPVVQHAYAAAGEYTAWLWVRDNCNATSPPDFVGVTIDGEPPCAGNLPPTAALSGPSTGEVDQLLAFSASGSGDVDGSIVAYSWSFGDGASANGSSVAHSYAAPGEYTVMLTVVDDCDAIAQDSLVVSVIPVDPCAENQAPTANAGPDQTAALSSPIVFDGSESTDADGTVDAYWWTFGNGVSTGWQGSASVSYTYPVAGAYTATLWVRDNCGAESQTDTATITINQTDPCLGNFAPFANALGGGSAEVGVPLPFFGWSSIDIDGEIVSHAWDFGDGRFGSGEFTAHSYSTPGNYLIRLTVTDDCGATGTDTVTATIIPGDPCAENIPPVADAGPDRQTQVGTVVVFSGSGSIDENGNISGYSWNFGDGGSADGPNVQHAFTTAGLHTVTLTVSDTCNASTQDTLLVVVSPVDPCAGNLPPVAAAGADQVIDDGSTASFNGAASSDPDGQITEYWWSFGDNQSTGWQSSPLAAHVYDGPGDYLVYLWVKDNCGLTSVFDTSLVTVESIDPCATNVAPTANAMGGGEATVGRVLGFFGWGSDDPDGSIVSYHWAFGDGATADGGSVSHAYATAGTYLVTLTVNDNCGATASDTVTVNVHDLDPCEGNHVPFASAGADLMAITGQPIGFNGSASSDFDGSIVSYNWNFGDGQGAVGAVVSHAFANAGLYTVMLTVTDDCGAGASDVLLAVVALPDPCADNIAPTASAGADKSGDVGVPISFNATASADPDGSIEAFWWDFGDGASTGWQPGSIAQHTYTQAGLFMLKLWVMDDCGASSAPDTALITIVQPDPCAGNQPPIAHVNGVSVGQAGQPITFNGGASTDADGQIVSFQWTFGDGTTGSGSIVSHTYVQPGNYSVVLTATDNCGASDTHTHAVLILPANPGELNAQFVIEEIAGIDPDTGEPIWEEIGGTAADPIPIGLRLRFNATSSTGALFYVWELSAGGQSYGPLVEFVYSDDGVFNARLEVTDSEGMMESVTRPVHVVNTMAYLDSLPLASDNANDAAIDGNIAWISHYNELLTAVDISNPANLIQVSSTPAAAGRAIAAAHGKVYLCVGTTALRIYQGTLPTPTFLGSYTGDGTDGQRSMDAVTIGNVLYMASGPAGIKVLNLIPSPSLQLLGSAPLPNGATAQTIEVRDGVAYVGDDQARVHLFNVSSINPANPSPGTVTLYKTIANGWTASFLSVSSNKVLVVYAAPGGMSLYDVSDPTDPGANLLDHVDLTDYSNGYHATGILAVDDTIYAGFGPTTNHGTAIAKIDISNPTDAYITEWLSLSAHVAGQVRSPMLRNGNLVCVNTVYNMVSVDVTP